MQKFQGGLEKLKRDRSPELNPWSSGEFRVILYEKTSKFQPSSETGVKGVFFYFVDCVVVCFVFLLICQWILQSIFVGLLLG